MNKLSALILAALIAGPAVTFNTAAAGVRPQTVAARPHHPKANRKASKPHKAAKHKKQKHAAKKGKAHRKLA